MKRHIGLLLCTSSLLFGCAANLFESGANNVAAVVKQPTQINSTATQAYQLGVGDRLRIDVWQSPELSTQATVRHDGVIAMPLAGEVRAQGRTPKALATAVQRALKRYLRDPVVTVAVEEAVSQHYAQSIRVVGAVQQPQLVQYRPGMTLLDAVLEAGGTIESANLQNVRLIDPQGVRSIRVDMKRMLMAQDMRYNPDVRPGDVVSVPVGLF